MRFTTLITAEELVAHIGNPDWTIADCRFVLLDPDAGRRAYEQSHIAGAVYAHLDNDLSAPVIPGHTGRHPLPDIATFTRTLSAWGIDAAAQVVAYDDMGGAFAARLWWLLRWLGHDAVAVLDGGWQLWQQAGHPTRPGNETRPPRTFVPQPRPDMLVTTDDVLRLHTDPAFLLVDARTADRYRGENEVIDPVAGHIPRAISFPVAAHHQPDGRFLPPDELRTHYTALLGAVPPANTIMYCGSGVTAAHNILALQHAGLGAARLYPGSWSEWITDPTRPVEVG